MAAAAAAAGGRKLPAQTASDQRSLRITRVFSALNVLIEMLGSVRGPLGQPEVYLQSGRSRCRCGSGETSPDADVAGVSPVPVQMWQG